MGSWGGVDRIGGGGGGLVCREGAGGAKGDPLACVLSVPATPPLICTLQASGNMAFWSVSLRLHMSQSRVIRPKVDGDTTSLPIGLEELETWASRVRIPAAWE